MTAAELIQEIEKLPNDERSKVIDFAREAAKRRPLTPQELGVLGERMLAAADPAEAERLRQEWVRGFYGEE
jgi:hypothetical protein